MERNYVAFISYRHAEMDSAIAKALHTAIEQYRVPRGLRKDGKRKLGLVFRDEEELHAASDLTAEIQQALVNTEFLIVICSENSVQSPWVSREVEFFLQHHDRSRVLAVLASGEPADVFPVQLTRTPEGDLIEPLAVDVRADTIAGNKKKVRRELPRLISAILDCPYDALVMREQRRKMRRITGIAAGAMAILLGFTSMVLAKNQQIELANTQLEVKNTELNQANTALAEQKAAVQLRESQLLTQNAQEYLDNADFYGAIETALEALPKDASDDRPYYAPAEQILMDAMGVFQTGEPETFLNTTTLQQVTNIADYVITKDGSRIVSVDEFGTTFCFDTVSAAQLWHRYAAQEDSIASSTPHLFLCSDDQIVIRSSKAALEALDLSTGNSLWSANVGSIAKNYLFYSETRDSLLLVVSRTVEIFSTAYEIIEVSASTGEVLQTIPLSISENSMSYTFSDSDALSKGGQFSRDGSYFYGLYIDNNKQMQCFRADLTEGTCKTIYSHDVSTMTYSTAVVDMFVRDDGSWNIVCKDFSDDTMLCVLAIDVETGSLLWQQDIPSPDSYYSSLTTGYAAFLNNGILIGCNDRFYLLDAATGQLLCTKNTPNVITSLQYVSSNIFGFSMRNGTYSIGWINDGIALTTDPDWDVSVPIGEHQTFRVWEGGILQAEFSETRYWLGIGNFVKPGYVTLIPAENENTIQIIRPVDSLRTMSHKPLEFPAEDFRTASSFTAQKIGSQWLLGPFNQGSDYDHSHYFTLSAAGQLGDPISLPTPSYSNEQFFIPGTLQPLLHSNYDGISILHPDGTQTTLYDPEADQTQLGEEDGWYSAFTLFRNSCNYLSDGQTLLTAVCNTRTLSLWKNGEFFMQTDLPEVLRIAPKESSNMNHLIKVSENGRILLGLHEFDNIIPAKNMAAYDPQQDLWACFRSDAAFSDSNAIALAHSKPLMAGVDQEGDLQIIDLQTGNTVVRFPTQLPSGSVIQMQFFLEDTHLAIKADGGHLLIYELGTGTLRYRDHLAQDYSNTLQIFEDPNHGRLYINCGPGNGLCLDLDSWTALARPETLRFYDSNTDLAYLSGGRYDSYSFFCGQIPDTMELVKLAADVLAEKP